MRQVHYERPKDHLDPLNLNSGAELRNHSAPVQSNHVNLIRSLRASQSADGTHLFKSQLEMGMEVDMYARINSAGDFLKGPDRPESRHMTSRSAENNHVNSMMALFHKDRASAVAGCDEEDPDYGDEQWDDEFEAEEEEDNNKEVSEVENEHVSEPSKESRPGTAPMPLHDTPAQLSEDNNRTGPVNVALDDLLLAPDSFPDPPEAPLYVPGPIQYDTDPPVEDSPATDFGKIALTDFVVECLSNSYL